MKTRVSSIFLAVILTFFGLSRLHAAYVFSPGFFYQTEEIDDGTSTQESAQSLIDLRAGYVSVSSLYLGFIYGIDNRESGSTEYERTSYGPSVGLMGQSFVVLFHYLLSSEEDRGSVIYEGTGLQFDFAYFFNISGRLKIGPQLSYKIFTYTKETSGGSTTDLASDREETRLDPYIAFSYMF